MYVTKEGPWLVNPNTGAIGPATWWQTLHKPNSVKRVKPTNENLFRHGTSRSVWSSVGQNCVYPQYISAVTGKVTRYGFLSAGAEATFDFSATDRSAQAKLLDRIKRQHVNLAQACAEYRQSSALMVTLSQEIMQGYRSFRRGHFGEIYRDFRRDKQASKKWIETQFGLLPLASDLKGACDSVTDWFKNQKPQTVVSSASDLQLYSREYRDPEGGGMLLRAHLETYEVRMKARFKIKDENIGYASSLGFTNPAALAWELLPWSFMIDYAIGIGGWLSRLDALIGVDDLLVQKTSKTVRALSVSASYGGVATATDTTIARGSPVTTIKNPTPRYEPSDSLRKVLNSVALLSLLKKESK